MMTVANVFEREYAKELEILRRPARLNKIADDIVNHIINRGYLGKAMVVSVDRFTAVRMYDLVTAKWQQKIAKINHELMSLNPTSAEYQTKLKIREWMRSTDMAVVISESQGDDERFAAEGLNLRPHRERMNDVNEEGQELQDLFEMKTTLYGLFLYAPCGSPASTLQWCQLFIWISLLQGKILCRLLRVPIVDARHLTCLDEKIVRSDYLLLQYLRQSEKSFCHLWRCARRR